MYLCIDSEEKYSMAELRWLNDGRYLGNAKSVFSLATLAARKVDSFYLNWLQFVIAGLCLQLPIENK